MFHSFRSQEGSENGLSVFIRPGTATPPSYDDDNGDAAECWMTDTYEPFISLFAGWLDDIHCYWPPVLLHLIMPVFYAFSLVFLLP